MANSEAPIGRLAVPGCDNLNRAAGNAAALSAAAARRKATIWLTSPWHVAQCALALRQMHALLRPAGRLFASFTHPCFRDRRCCGGRLEPANTPTRRAAAHERSIWQN